VGGRHADTLSWIVCLDPQTLADPSVSIGSTFGKTVFQEQVKAQPEKNARSSRETPSPRLAFHGTRSERARLAAHPAEPASAYPQAQAASFR